jgi:hypothetical protein
MFWICFSAFVLWMMSRVNVQSFDLGSFLWFTSELLGGGVSFYFLTEMLRTPINPENDAKWNSVIKYALLSTVTVLSVAGVALFEKYFYSSGGILTIVSILAAIFIICSFADKAATSFSQIEKHS